MPTELTFTVTNPDGSTLTIIPTEYRSDWPFLYNQSLSFKCYDGQLIDERATIIVSKAGIAMPVFCGWFDQMKRPSFKSGRPQQYHCSGFSKLLNFRSSFQKSYANTVQINNLLGDTITNQGLLFIASSLATGWELSNKQGAPTNTYCLERTGTDALYTPRIPLITPAIYLGSTLLTASASLEAMQVNEWFRDADRIYIRTSAGEPTGNPQTYPCYILNFKNCHLRAGSISTDTLVSPGVDVLTERLWTSFMRVAETQGLEFSFVNRSDGDQDVDARKTIYRGWYDDPVKSYLEVDLIDFESGTMDDSKHGFDSVILRGRTNTFNLSLLPPNRWGRSKAIDEEDPLAAGIYKEHIPFQSIMSEEQLVTRAAYMLGQMADERYLRVWARPDYALKLGDFIRVTITSEPYAGQYNMRLFNKAFESRLGGDVMELTLYDGYNPED